MTSMLNDKKVLVVGRGSGIARAIATTTRSATAARS
jgi:NAD(P)-dependent dehydrogenase (short-subunit alcohol dehydrogenase family)